MMNSLSRSLFFGILSTVIGLMGCTRTPYDSSLPQSTELGNPEGYRIARVISHFHSPYSWDACDKAGLNGTQIDTDCLHRLKNAFCQNRVDTVFMTDHPDSMAKFEMPDLLLKEDGDQLINSAAGTPYANQLGSCANGAKPVIMVGFEARMMGLGMTNHLAGSPTDRQTLYGNENADLRSRVQNQANGVVIVPHTESRSLSMLRSVSPDGIEIYNIHANLDPKIRKTSLGLDPFSHIAAILAYLLDSDKKLIPDFLFMHFVMVHPSYFQKWDQLEFENFKMAGWGGTDSHENIFPQKASDGERLDSHRRLTRFMSNHLLVHSLDPEEIKAALKKGRGSVVFEGFGSPVGMDFSATTTSGTYVMGDSVSLAGGSAQLHVVAPTLHSSSPKGQEAPLIRMELRQVIAGGQDQVVASSSGGDIQYTATAPGAYRVHVYITPKHLRPFLANFSSVCDAEYQWIITNHIYLDP